MAPTKAALEILGAYDDENLGGVPERQDVTAFEYEAAQYTSHNNNRADNLDHEVAVNAKSL
jgi:hypothetical protein